MNKRIVLLVLSSLIGFSAVPVFAANGCQGNKAPAKAAKPAKPAPKKVISSVCPVMGTKIPDITKAAGKSIYKGKTYYFCCAGCKPEFDKNPEKYIKKRAK
jgi:YHS domain-containing protein